ncbi:MAG: leucyl/phenylalanyl-tRNA--protein transferase [Methylococcales bacterium]
MNIDQLKFVEKTQDFPDISQALIEPDGLLAYSHSLSSKLLVYAYSQGIFPWYDKTQPILWWSPSTRAILMPDEIKFRKSLKQSIRKNNYTVTINKDFNSVIEKCASVKRAKQSDTWITQEMILHYQHLHQMGIAHSIECWQHQQLVGGLYGIYSQGLFCGESMFSEKTDASKSCLIALAQNAKSLGIKVIDCQIQNSFLQSMGVKEISRDDFLSYFSASSAGIRLTKPIMLDIH